MKTGGDGGLNVRDWLLKPRQENKKNMEKKQNQKLGYGKIDVDIQLKDALQEESPHQLTIVDDSNPQSLINLVHPSFRPKLLAIPEELLALSFEEIKERLNPTVTHYRLRYAFWNEFECSLDQGRMMRMSRVYAGICGEKHFSEVLSKNQVFMAFLLNQPTDYITVVKESLQAGMENLRKIVSSNVHDEDGNLIPRAADVVIKGIALLDLRVKGAVIQRIDQRLVSLNVNKDIEAQSDPDGSADIPNSLEQLEQEIEKVKNQLLNREPVRGVHTTTDLVNYAERTLNMKFSPEKEVVELRAVERSKSEPSPNKFNKYKKNNRNPTPEDE